MADKPPPYSSVAPPGPQVPGYAHASHAPYPEPTLPPYPVGFPSPPAYHAGPEGPPTVVIQQPVAIPVHLTAFGRHSVRTHCPHCRQDVLTVAETEPGCLTWLLCMLLFIFGFVWGCCLIPFCIDGTKNTVHSCPFCKRVLGQYAPL